MGSRWRDAALDGRLGLAVVASGVALCTIGTLLEPRSHPDVEWAWWAQLLACVFWAGACGTAMGVLRRRRVALLAALASAMSFAVAAATVPFVTRPGVTLAWYGEMACALAFVTVVVRAISLSRAVSSPVQEPPRLQVARRAPV
jgi:peptidoglycan/LPS O-acetylase OafA/YrhL